MYVLYKSKNILTLVTIGHIVGFIVGMYIEYCLWAQVAVLDIYILHILNCLGQVNVGFIQGLYLGRAPRTKETLPDFHEECRATRHSRVFRGLTGSQRTPGFWGITPSLKPVKQRRRSFAPERQKAIKEEVGKLLQAGAIREVEYPEWLANVVLVQKANCKWRICIDFTDVNKACPKDSFPLPCISLIVDATVGHELLSFMDAFSGYNQISMDPDDQEKTSFVTAQGTYCYRVMPFGLKNAGATYQRLVNRMFQKQIETTMEVYIDDILVKSTTAELHIAHLSEAFQILREYNMKLNPAKCAFGVSAEKFLGFIVNNRGIEANPDKIKAVLDMPSPSGIKEVQRMTGRIVALSRFVSKASDKCQPFFQVLKKAFQWDAKCEKTFSALKTYLSSPPPPPLTFR